MILVPDLEGDESARQKVIDEAIAKVPYSAAVR
jgi:hypothetical protein